MDKKMKVEIWSDIMCPFCYIGKREFEKALQAFPENKVDVEWKSYQLAPDLVTDEKKSLNEYLADAKGIPAEQADQMNAQVSQRAETVGLHYNYKKAIPANTLRAHSLIHFAKKYGKQNDAEELLFRAYFTEGRNIDDLDTLLETGKTLGLDVNALNEALEQETYKDAVQEDIYESYQLGVRGVPFFVFDRKYAVSGAQPSQAFAQTLEKAYSEWESSQKKAITVEQGESCGIDGSCG